MWILLLLFHTTTFSLVFDSAEECLAFAAINQPYWLETEQSLEYCAPARTPPEQEPTWRLMI